MRAAVDPAAEALLAEVAGAYRALTSLELGGQMTLSLVEEGRLRTRTASFRSAFAAPNLFRHEAAGQPLLGSTGHKLYAFVEARNAYAQFDAPATRCRLSDLPPDHATILVMQNLSLALSLSDDPAEELRRMSSRISVGESENVDGQQLLSLRLTVADRGPLELLIHPETKLIRRIVMDFGPVFAKIGRTDVTSALFTVDYTTIDARAQFKPESFAWSPPAGATNVAQTRPGLDELTGP